MAQEQYKHAVGTFKDMENPALALTELKSAGFPMDRVSIVAKNPDVAEEETELGREKLSQLLDPTKLTKGGIAE